MESPLTTALIFDNIWRIKLALLFLIKKRLYCNLWQTAAGMQVFRWFFEAMFLFLF